MSILIYVQTLRCKENKWHDSSACRDDVSEPHRKPEGPVLNKVFRGRFQEPVFTLMSLFPISPGGAVFVTGGGPEAVTDWQPMGRCFVVFVYSMDSFACLIED